ncbi:hypothetical protein [Saccharopolyspora shandongensis]|uniref:hypothetical protein n=1 Tax=Saccharopolyspora shandongensis TaxID=418495 RepID=UPI0033D708EE
MTKVAAGRLDVYLRQELFDALESARSVADRRHALGAPEADIRKAAVYAMGCTPSVRYKPLLGSLRERDPILASGPMRICCWRSWPRSAWAACDPGPVACGPPLRMGRWYRCVAVGS